MPSTVAISFTCTYLSTDFNFVNFQTIGPSRHTGQLATMQLGVMSRQISNAVMRDVATIQFLKQGQKVPQHYTYTKTLRACCGYERALGSECIQISIPAWRVQLSSLCASPQFSVTFNVLSLGPCQPRLLVIKKVAVSLARF